MEKGQEVAKISGEGVFDGRIVRVLDKEFAEQLYQRGYGMLSGEILELTLVEAAYLVYREMLKVKDDQGRTLSFPEIVRLASNFDPDFWVKLNVYTDLRNRALPAKPGVNPYEFLVDWKKKGKPRRLLVRILREGTRVSFPEFEDMFRRALESDRELVIAIVDKEGVVTYYTVEGGSYEQVGASVEDNFEVPSE
ncbi:tRNA intron endonuclease [Thermofilum pendens]|uniref:tRNA splicing endonuclease n=1 Tax=Thermofilum pendens (strain DSM 2475 / Hrk 5) TaxID=368408 RepID=A1RWZ0_THEPD|nr:tRNA intron endonuclease [Thermofilum pendens]ABL77720.1 tRNA splicing endonuclease [Thermofilum pendens Hrk 5]